MGNGFGYFIRHWQTASYTAKCCDVPMRSLENIIHMLVETQSLIQHNTNAFHSHWRLNTDYRTIWSSPHHVAQHRPTGSETTPSYAPRSSRFGTEPPSVEDVIDVWRYAILSCMPETPTTTEPSTAVTSGIRLRVGANWITSDLLGFRDSPFRSRATTHATLFERFDLYCTISRWVSEWVCSFLTAHQHKKAI